MNVPATERVWDDEAAIVEFQEQARAAGALGFYEDDATHALVVVIPTSRLNSYVANAPAIAPVEITIQTTAVEAEQLQRARDKLADLIGGFPDNSMAFGFDPRLARLEVITTIDLSTISKALGNDVDVIDYNYGSVELLKSRQADTPSFWGGAALAADQTHHDLNCTSGMSVLRNGGAGKPVLVTAGHCYNQGDDVYTPAGKYVGRVVQRRCGDGSGNDMETIEGTSYSPSIYLGGINSSTGGNVVGAGAVAVGTAQYRYSGAKTGENGLYTVVDDDWDVYFYPEDRPCDPWVIHVLRVQHIVNGQPVCDADLGDSGAPFYYRDNFNNVKIRGMIIARNGTQTACFAESWSRIQGQLNVVIDT
jgi:hypothetical protein